MDEVLLRISYDGNLAALYSGEELIADSFYTGETWEIGISRFLKDKKEFEGELCVMPLKEHDPVFLEKNPGCRAALGRAETEAVFRVRICLPDRL